MGLDAKHPLYDARLPDWQKLSDCYEGERAVKAAGETYLPATSGMVEDGMGETQPGGKAYAAYKLRARFPDDMQEAVQGILGVMHRKEAVIKVPAAMEPMLDRITTDGADALTLLRRINEAQLVHGRVGMLLEVADGAPVGSTPFVTMYAAPSIINWQTEPGVKDGISETALVVLDESGPEMNENLEWIDVQQHRVLALSTFVENTLASQTAKLAPISKDPTKAETQDGADTEDGGDISADAPPDERVAAPVYRVAVATETLTLGGLEWLEPSLAGTKLEKVPFVFVNSVDLCPDPDRPPLLGLADLCLSMYRGEADYRQTLFMQGQETLVIKDNEIVEDVEGEAAGEGRSKRRIGAGAIIELTGKDSDAKYIGISADGLREMREAMDDDREIAAQRGMKLMDLAEGSSQQSGDALRIRVASRTASATNIARAGAAALQAILRHAATWMNLNPEEVEVEPNLEWAEQIMTGKELAEWMQAKNQGAPIALETIHDQMRARGVTTKTFEEEQAAAESDPMMGSEQLGALGDPNAPPGSEPKGAPPRAKKDSQQEGPPPKSAAERKKATAKKRGG